jgi:hypothetical protein
MPGHGVWASIHTAPALLLADTHGLNRPAARLENGDGGDKKDDAPAPTSKFRKKW